MKKIYLCAIALSVGSLSFGQQLTGKAFSEEKQQRTIHVGTTPNPTTANYKAPGDIIWAEDFNAQTGLPSGWTSVDNTGNAAPWIMNTSMADLNADYTTNQTVIASTSGGNHMLYFSDGYQSPMPSGGYYEVDAYFQTDAIALTGQLGVSVNFEQSFRNCCSNVPGPISVLAVSTDPTFATNVAEYDIVGGVATNVASADPMDMSVNITAIAGGVTGNIYLRWHIQAGIEAYYWMIDDITVVESPINDMVAINGFYGFTGVQYTRIPVAHIQPGSFSIQASNIGVADQINTKLAVDINDGASSVFTTNTTPMTFNSLATDTFELDSVWSPSTTIGLPYTVTLTMVSDSTDYTPANNGIVFPPFEVSQSVMALDDYSATPGNGGGNPGPGGVTEYEAGNQFDATVNDVIYSLDVVTGDNTPVGTFVDVVLYEIDFTASPAAYVELARTTPVAIVAGDLGVVKNFLFPSSVSVTAGSVYFAAVHSIIGYEFGISGLNPPAGAPGAQHSAIRYPNMHSPNASSSFGYTNTPMVRLNFAAPTSIEASANGIAFNVYPNPSTGEFNINLSSNEDNTVALSVKNIVGQTIINETVSVSGKTNHTISLSDYSKGVYFLTIGNETIKLIVE